ncbi:MAG TPA: cyclic nucleotide-binding domain-containing protein [Rectinemataceae bacterium]|nr:cyclic nucleotide-binding domain-containing protein [Rectinemataceae bacterium]
MELVKKQSDQTAAIRSLVTFRFLTEAEAEKLMDCAEVARYEEGEPVVEEGELSPWFFGILEGTLSVGLATVDRGEVYVNSLGPGDVFGEAGMFLQAKRTATVRALAPSTLVRLHRGGFAAFIKENPSAGNKVLLAVIYSLLRKLRATNEELAYERKSDASQDEIDTLVQSLIG